MTIKLFAFYFKDTIGFRLDMLIIAKLLYADILFQIFLKLFSKTTNALFQIFFNLKLDIGDSSVENLVLKLAI
jgi:hypothetical protein